MQTGYLDSGPDQMCFAGILSCLKRVGITGRCLRCRALVHFDTMLICVVCYGKGGCCGKVMAKSTQRHQLFPPQHFFADL